MGLFGSKKSDKYKRDRHGYDRFGFDADGYDKDGYDVQGYDRDRCDRTGFDIQGYNKKGFNIDGFDFYGFDVNGYDKKGYDKDGFDRDEINKITGTKFDQHRCDKDGYDKDGFDFYGFDVNGYDKKGYDKDGFDRDGLEKVTGIGFDVDGYDQNGYDKDGYYRDGYNKKGYDVDGYDKKGYDKDGYNKNGFDKYIAKDFELTSTFSKITSTYDSDFAAVIAMTYDEPTKMKSKLFFSHEKKMGIYSKDFESFSNNNVVHIRIEKAGKHSNAKWIKPKDTGKTQGDNLEPGYTLIVNFNKNDPSLKHFVIGKLAELKFGSLPSGYTFHCHRNEDYPTDERAKELLQTVVKLFNSENDAES